MTNYQNTNLTNKIIGVLLILLGLIIFVTFTIWIILAKVLNFEELMSKYNQVDYELTFNVLNFLRDDKVYCVFIPIFFPILIVVSYCRWTAFNYFKYCS